MFKDFYESMWKKTTPQEKKEVVKNTGKYFPQEHSNKIKGIDELAEAVVNNAMKKQDDIVKNNKATSAAYTTKNCEKCGKEFQCYRNRGKYCKDCAKEMEAVNRKKYEERKSMEKKITPRIHENALSRARRRGTSYEYELTKILNGYDPLRTPNKDAKINTMTFDDMKKKSKKESATYRGKNKVIETAVGKASQQERAVASRRAYRNKTGYLYELDRILSGAKPIRAYTGSSKPKTIVEEPTQPIQEEQVEQALEEVETVHEFDYLGTLELAIEIVRGVKDEEDVKLAVDKVFETLKNHLTK